MKTFTEIQILKAIETLNKENNKNWYDFPGETMEERKMQIVSEHLGMLKLLQKLINESK